MFFQRDVFVHVLYFFLDFWPILGDIGFFSSTISPWDFFLGKSSGFSSIILLAHLEIWLTFKSREHKFCLLGCPVVGS